jgi:uncharacterized protein (DUF885 family)
MNGTMNNTSDVKKLLYDLFDEAWEFDMREFPLFATRTGDHRYNDKLPHPTLADSERRTDKKRGFLKRLENINRDLLEPEDRLNYDIFKDELSNQIADHEYGVILMPVSSVYGPHVYFPDLPIFVPLNDVQDYENYFTRLEAFREFADENIELMREGLSKGFIPPKVALNGVQDSIQTLIIDDLTQSPLFKPFESYPKHVSDRDRTRLGESGYAAIENSIIPGYEALLKFMVDEYIPAAREDIACSSLPNGRAYYEYCVRKYTSLDLTPEEVHETGLSEVRRIREEMDAVIKESGFEGDFHAFLEFLRTDSRFYVESPGELMKEVALILKKMDGQLPTLFEYLPRTPYGIREIPEHTAPRSTTAYYYPFSGDGTTAGFYYVNTYDLKNRPLYEYEALSLHEAVPGHHLQLALQIELTGVPNFRRYVEATAFIEGWALYAERLGLETGFYQDPYSNFGRLTYEMWRATRLVVDTGMHYMDWSRERAIEFMSANTALSPLNIENEIDRYISWPGQALAYKIGEIEIRKLRELGERKLGKDFDLRRFHKIVLEEGGIPLNILSMKIKAWIENQSAK